MTAIREISLRVSPSFTRTACIVSFRAAERQATPGGCLALNRTSAAGMLLVEHAGDVDAAIASAEVLGGWWAGAIRVLETIRKEEA